MTYDEAIALVAQGKLTEKKFYELMLAGKLVPTVKCKEKADGKRTAQ